LRVLLCDSIDDPLDIADSGLPRSVGGRRKQPARHYRVPVVDDGFLVNLILRETAQARRFRRRQGRACVSDECERFLQQPYAIGNV
jgi:hypothetical protein